MQGLAARPQRLELAADVTDVPLGHGVHRPVLALLRRAAGDHTTVIGPVGLPLPVPFRIGLVGDQRGGVRLARRQIEIELEPHRRPFLVRADGKFRRVLERLARAFVVIVIDVTIDVDHLGDAEDGLEPMQHQRIAAVAAVGGLAYAGAALFIDYDRIAAGFVHVRASRACCVDLDVAPQRHRQEGMVAARSYEMLVEFAVVHDRIEDRIGERRDVAEKIEDDFLDLAFEIG